MKKAILALTLLTLTLPAFSQTRADYDTAVNQFVRFFNTSQWDSIYNRFSERIQTLSPIIKTRGMLNDLFFQLDDIEKTEYIKSIDRISYYKTEFHHTTLTLLISLNSDKKIETFRFVPYQAEEIPSNIVLKTPAGSIFGTLTMPEGNKSKKVPVVLIIPGSGPTDRNGNQTGMTSNMYKMLADSLSERGVATVRYDKRGVGESAAAGGNESTLVFENYIEDATGFVEMLKKDKRFSKVIIFGHSEGSLIGIVAAQRAKPSALISASGPAQKIDKIIKKQLFEKSDELARKAGAIFDSLELGYDVQDIDINLEPLFRKSIQPYMRSWLKYDPQAEIRKLNMPILIVQGTTDVQVGKAHGELLKEAKPDAQLVIIDGMSHVLKPGPADRKLNLATYSNPSLALSPGLIPAIADFIEGVKK